MQTVRYFLAIFLVMLGGVLFGVAASTYLWQAGVLTGGWRAYVVMSGSMEPAIMTGNLVVTKPEKQYETGDIITFSGGQELMITHRVTSIRQENGQAVYTTKGDANAQEDLTPVYPESISGRVAFQVPYLGRFIELVKTPKGFVIFVIVPATIVIYEELKSLFGEFRKLFKRKERTSIN